MMIASEGEKYMNVEMKVVEKLIYRERRVKQTKLTKAKDTMKIELLSVKLQMQEHSNKKIKKLKQILVACDITTKHDFEVRILVH